MFPSSGKYNTQCHFTKSHTFQKLTMRKHFKSYPPRVLAIDKYSKKTIVLKFMFLVEELFPWGANEILESSLWIWSCLYQIKD